MPEFGKILIVFGATLIVLGAFLSASGHVPWLGRLPGDIAIKRENFSFYFPLTTSLILSVLLSLVFYLFRR